MQFLLIPVLGLAPGLFWLWLIYRGNKYRPEPKRLVIRTFLFGMAATIPAITFVESASDSSLCFTHLKDFMNFTVANLSHLSLRGNGIFLFHCRRFHGRAFQIPGGQNHHL